MNNALLAAPDATRHFQPSLLSAFNEIAHTFLEACHRLKYASLQCYLDGRVAISGAPVTRRSVLLAVQDMKEDLIAPLTLQEGVLAEAKSLEMRPRPKLKLYRDVATAILRMEIVMRSAAQQTLDYAETKH